MTITLEREIKLRFDNIDDARRAVLATEATPIRSRRLQEDCLLDTDDGMLSDRGCVLRVRTETGKSQLTFKGPIQPSTMKLREELETVVGDGVVLLRVLEELGLRVWFRYQKYREEYAFGDVIIAIDETPVGTYIEIEGGEPGIAAMSEALGRTPADYLLDSYRGLFRKFQAERGLDQTDMLFEES